MSSHHKTHYLLIVIVDTHKMDRPQPLLLRPPDVIDIVINEQGLFRLGGNSLEALSADEPLSSRRIVHYSACGNHIRGGP
jgi:hypothetical protein